MNSSSVPASAVNPASDALASCCFRIVRGDGATGRWSDLTDDLLRLTEKVQGAYRSVADEAGPSEEEVREAFRTLAGAWNQIAGAVGAAISDPEVKSQVKRATSSLVSAIGATLAEMSSRSPESEGAEVAAPRGQEEANS